MGIRDSVGPMSRQDALPPINEKGLLHPTVARRALEHRAQHPVLLAHELPRLILEYRELVILKSTYIDALPRLVNPTTGRVHTTFHQTGPGERARRASPKRFR